MEAVAPRIRVVRRQCAPKFFPCPHCGHKGRRFTTHIRARPRHCLRRASSHRTDGGRIPRPLLLLQDLPRSDGSNLYPAILADLWPNARHQLCIFHVLKDINTHVFDALRRLRRRLASQDRRKRRRGRLSKAQRRARARHGPTRKEQAYFIWKHRHLLVTRPEHLNGRERKWLRQMFQYLPALRMLRQFVLKSYRLFDPDQSPHQARCRRAALVNDPTFSADPDLAKALAMLSPAKFEKMIAYLHSPAHRRIRTNNHVERTNRRLRSFEKVRYKWRRRRTIVRFMVLAFDRWHKARLNSQPPQFPRKRASDHLPRFKPTE